jgi:hypothetical protein
MVDVRIGEPVETAGASLDDRDQLIDIVRARIEELLLKTQDPRPTTQDP